MIFIVIFQIIDLFTGSITHLLAAYIFVWRTFDPCFIKYIIQIQNINFDKKDIIQYTLLLFCFLIGHLIIVGHGNAIYKLISNSDQYIILYETKLSFLSYSGCQNFILTVLIHVVDAWLEIFKIAYTLLIMMVIICLTQNIKGQNTSLDELIKSKEMYEDSTFYKWKRQYKKSAILADQLNEKLKFCVFFTIFVNTINIMSVIYTTTVVCSENEHVIMWIIKYAAFLVAFVCPGAVLSYQVLFSAVLWIEIFWIHAEVSIILATNLEGKSNQFIYLQVQDVSNIIKKIDLNRMSEKDILQISMQLLLLSLLSPVKISISRFVSPELCFVSNILLKFRYIFFGAAEFSCCLHSMECVHFGRFGLENGKQWKIVATHFQNFSSRKKIELFNFQPVQFNFKLAEENRNTLEHIGACQNSMFGHFAKEKPV